MTFTLSYEVGAGTVMLSIVYNGIARFNTGDIIYDGGTETLTITGDTSHVFVRVIGDPGAAYSFIGTADFELSAPQGGEAELAALPPSACPPPSGREHHRTVPDALSRPSRPFEPEIVESRSFAAAGDSFTVAVERQGRILLRITGVGRDQDEPSNASGRAPGARSPPAPSSSESPRLPVSSAPAGGPGRDSRSASRAAPTARGPSSRLSTFGDSVLTLIDEPLVRLDVQLDGFQS